MKSFAIVAAFAAAAVAAPQGVTSDIAPKQSAPAGCKDTYDGTFQIEVRNATSSNTKRSYQKRQDSSTPLECTLKNGVLTDAKGRTGYIADNYQFQFDGPAQTGAIYTAGFSICNDETLALGDDEDFFQCRSGMFYNLYDPVDDENDDKLPEQCSKAKIYIIGSGSSVASASVSGAASQLADGQVTATPVTQIADGQIQASTGAAAPVTQIGDGQIQAPTSVPKNPVTQIADGQIQAPTAVPSNPVTQIADGQIQAPVATPSNPVTQIADGQIQAPVNNGSSAGNFTSSTPQVFTGAASLPVMNAEILGLAVGVVALALF